MTQGDRVLVLTGAGISVCVGHEEPDNAAAFSEHRVGAATEVVPALFRVPG